MSHNPVNHITQGLRLNELTGPHQWSSGPAFLIQSPDQWPSMPKTEGEPDCNELKKSPFIGTVSVLSSSLPDPSQFHTRQELIEATVRSLHGAATTDTDSPMEASEYIEMEKLLLAQAQMDSFPVEVRHLKAGHPVPQNSRLG